MWKSPRLMTSVSLVWGMAIAVVVAAKASMRDRSLVRVESEKSIVASCDRNRFAWVNICLRGKMRCRDCNSNWDQPQSIYTPLSTFAWSTSHPRLFKHSTFLNERYSAQHPSSICLEISAQLFSQKGRKPWFTARTTCKTYAQDFGRISSSRSRSYWSLLPDWTSTCSEFACTICSAR